jgi:CRP/FNR family cyclic AMP-dependent transcriptional regulator
VAAHVVHVLDEDPELSAALAEPERALATQHLVAAELRLPAGEWRPAHPLGGAPGDLGFLILDGLLVRDTVVGRHVTAELLGQGDLLRPWDHVDGGGAPITTHHAWRVLEPTRLAVLDARFGAIAGRFPTVTATIIARTVRRSRLLGVMLAVSAMPRLDERLLTLMWALADRWGRVGPDGTTVPLPLTHATIARLVGAQRPSVTSTLKSLEDRGFLVRAADTTGWLLIGDPPGDAEQALAHQAETSTA